MMVKSVYDDDICLY